jgi:hypothetical protein
MYVKEGAKNTPLLKVASQYYIYMSMYLVVFFILLALQ